MPTTRVATAGTYNAGDIISAADINAMPGGTIGRDDATSNSAGTASTEVPMSCAPSVGDDREITIHLTVNLQTLDGAIHGQATIFEDGVQLQRKNCFFPANTTDVCITTFVVSTPGSAATHTYEGVTGVSGDDGGTVICVNNGGAGGKGKSLLIVQDTGPGF